MSWLGSLFKKEYELTIWFKGATTVNVDGSQTFVTAPKVYKCKKIITISDTFFKVIDIDGCTIEIKTLEPVAYTLKQIRS